MALPRVYFAQANVEGGPGAIAPDMARLAQQSIRMIGPPTERIASANAKPILPSITRATHVVILKAI